MLKKLEPSWLVCKLIFKTVQVNRKCVRIFLYTLGSEFNCNKDPGLRSLRIYLKIFMNDCLGFNWIHGLQSLWRTWTFSSVQPLMFQIIKLAVSCIISLSIVDAGCNFSPSSWEFKEIVYVWKAARVFEQFKYLLWLGTYGLTTNMVI